MIAIPLLDLLAVALMALVLMAGLYLIFKGIAALASHMPFIGGTIANAATAAGAVVQAQLKIFFKQVAGDASALFEWFYEVGRRMFTAQIHVVTAAASAIQSIIAVRIPLLTLWTAAHILDALNTAKVFARTLVHAARIELYHAIGLARTYAHTLAALVLAAATYGITEAKVYAHHLAALVQAQATYGITEAKVYAHHLAALVQAQADFNIGQLRQWSQGAIGALGTWTAGQLAQLRSDTQSAIGAAETNVVNTLHHETTIAVQDIWAPTATEAEKVIGAVQGLWPGVLPQDLSIPTDVPLTGAAALAGIMSAVGALSTYADECGIPTCRNLGGFGKDLQALLSLIGGGALLAFLAEAVAHPETVAHDISDIGGPLAGGVETAIKDLIAAV